MSETKFTPGEWKQHHRMRECVTFEGKHGTENLFLSNVEGYYACQNEHDAALIASAKQLYNAVEKQHAAIDRLLALLIAKDPDFMPTKSKVWPLLMDADAPRVLDKARGEG